MPHWSEKPDVRREKDPNRDAELAKKHLQRAYKQAKGDKGSDITGGR
jgi:hypothetical protein